MLFARQVFSNLLTSFFDKARVSISSGRLRNLYLYSTRSTSVFTFLGASSSFMKVMNSSSLSGVGRAMQNPLTGMRESSPAGVYSLG